MLAQIKSSVLRDESPISFHSGLNIVLGDGTNSIGKSSCLNMIDFAFGGSYYASNKDIIANLGDHEINYVFQFGNKEHYFKRNTTEKKTVYRCNKEFDIIEAITLDAFNIFLNSSYMLDELGTTFRSMVSLYSRIWDKENQKVNHPLYLYRGQNVNESIANLIKLFNMYSEIKELDRDRANAREIVKAYKAAFKYEIVPTVQNKSAYNQNNRRVDEINNALSKALAHMNMSIQDREVSLDEKSRQLMNTRNNLINKKNQSKRELERIEKNLDINTKIDTKNFEELQSFFPGVNTDKLQSVQDFHNQLCQVLSDELEKAKAVILNDLEVIENDLSIVSLSMQENMGISDASQLHFNRVVDLLQERNHLIEQNESYDKQLAERQREKDDRLLMKDKLNDITNEIANQINQQLIEFSGFVLGNNSRPPQISLKPQNYEYFAPGNTGTGKAYSDLILFDLSVLQLTRLPILIHDSFLFNNIDDLTMGQFVKLYNKFPDKQLFISMDKLTGAFGFDSEEYQIVAGHTVRYLTDDKTLYKKDWRNIP